MSIRVPLAAGTVLNLAAVSGLACFDPGPAGWPRLSPRHPLASYAALASAAFGSGWELFALAALIFAACFLAAGLRHARRAARDDSEGAAG